MNGAYVSSGNERLGITSPIDDATTPSSSMANASARLDDSATDRDESDIKGKVESRLLSMWNNMKFGWTVKLRTNFSKESPVWLLGSCYHRKLSPSGSVESSTEIGTEATAGASEQCDGDGIEGFKADFASRVWMSYRREFPSITGSTLTTDCGWGCMLRSGQMMLAQAMLCHFLGRDWRWRPERAVTCARDYQLECWHRAIVRWFGDEESVCSPLSIHRMVTLGEESLGKRAGDWYGPASVAHCLQVLLASAAHTSQELSTIGLHVVRDGTLYAADVRAHYINPHVTWSALILLVPVKLGADKFNPIYGPCLTSLLTLECCIGIIGGRPKHSLYFVGYQDDKLIHLDPHYCQDAVDTKQPNFPLSSYHCRTPRKMALSKMDPSCCIGFYLRSMEQFETFVDMVKPFLVPGGSTDYPMFSISDGYSSDVRVAPGVRYSMLETDQHWVTPSIHDCDMDIESEEFVII